MKATPCGCECHTTVGINHIEDCCDGECPGCKVAYNGLKYHVVDCKKYELLVNKTKRHRQHKIRGYDAYSKHKRSN